MLVNSVPLSETHMAGRPRTAMRASSSRRARPPLTHLERGTQVGDSLALGSGVTIFLRRSP
jgi:hypothetical protein